MAIQLRKRHDVSDEEFEEMYHTVRGRASRLGWQSLSFSERGDYYDTWSIEVGVHRNAGLPE